jgi:hypothetical protein
VYKKARSTQSIVNTFPSWSNTRKDEQSLGFQFLNVIGHQFDDFKKQIKNNIDSFYLPTSNISDIDVYYKYKLSPTFEFVEDTDNTEILFIPPVVTGAIDDVNFNVIMAEKNDIETFWYKAIPSRISLNGTNNENHIIASDTTNKSPFSPASEELHIPNKITVKISGGTSFLELYENNFLRKAIIQITGTTREGIKVTEELLFLHNETQQTWREFKSIDLKGIKLYGFEDADSTLATISSAAFNQTDYPINYELDADIYGDDMPYFWALGSTPTVGAYSLDLKRYDTNDLELRIQGFTTKHVVLSQELQNTAGENFIPLDLTIEPHSSRIWIVSATKLYLFEESFPYPDLSVLNKKQYDACSVIEPSSYYAVIGEEIELDYLWIRPVNGMVAHRAWVQKPNGNKYSLENGDEVDFHTGPSSWIFGEPLKRKIRDTEIYTLDQRGDYIYSLEVKYANETTSIDQRIVTVSYIKPLAEFNLASLDITAQGIDFDSEYKMWILGSNGTKYQINLHYDNMLIDFRKKILYFREPYEKIAVAGETFEEPTE